VKAIILAGGFGTRLSEETDYIPKPMVKIGGRPILWHIMKIFSYYGINDFIICLGYKGYMIKEYFCNYQRYMSDFTVNLRTGEMQIYQSEAEPWQVTLIDTGLRTETGGRLKRVREYVQGETFCLTYGDGLADINISELISFHRRHGKTATVTAITPPGRFGILKLNGERVDSFAEKLDTLGSRVNGGFFVLEPEVIDYIEGDATIWERRPMEMLAANNQLNAYLHDGFWKAMDTLREKRELEQMWNSGQAPWVKWQ
jgi:glucose-1-phosphate cytidylyltransferase